MAFLDKLKQTAGIAAQVAVATADTAVNKTKTVASAGRVRLAIISEEEKLKKAYAELGRLFYRDYEAQAEADMTEYLPWCSKAADAREQIHRLTEELESLKVNGKEPVASSGDAMREDTSIYADVEEDKLKTQSVTAVKSVEGELDGTTVDASAGSEGDKIQDNCEMEEATAAIPQTSDLSSQEVVGTFYLDTSNQDNE